MTGVLAIHSLSVKQALAFDSAVHCFLMNYVLSPFLYALLDRRFVIFAYCYFYVSFLHFCHRRRGQVTHVRVHG